MVQATGVTADIEVSSLDRALGLPVSLVTPTTSTTTTTTTAPATTSTVPP